jgi:hypothetical protein
MSVSISFGVEQQPVEASEAEELSTLPKTQVRPFAHFHPSLPDISKTSHSVRCVEPVISGF